MFETFQRFHARLVDVIDCEVFELAGHDIDRHRVEHLPQHEQCLGF